MPEVNNAMRPASQESGTEHNVGAIFQDRCKKDWVFVRVIFQVGVLNDYYVSSCVLKARTQSCSLAKIALLQHKLIDPSVRFRLKKFSRSIGRSVIHHDDFEGLDRCGADCFYDSFNRRLLIVTRDNDR